MWYLYYEEKNSDILRMSSDRSSTIVLLYYKLISRFLLPDLLGILALNSKRSCEVVIKHNWTKYACLIVQWRVTAKKNIPVPQVFFFWSASTYHIPIESVFFADSSIDYSWNFWPNLSHGKHLVQKNYYLSKFFLNRWKIKYSEMHNDFENRVFLNVMPTF